MPDGVCRVCGCTEEWGCDEGCFWVEPDLCSSCVGAEPVDSEPPPDLGPCCACGQAGPTVRNILMLHQRAPVAGTGWGCFVCGLPTDGATAVVCDACLEAQAEIRQVCHGYPLEHGRVPRAELLPEPFEHDMSRHPEAAHA